MRIAELMRRMREAGAPLEAVVIAVEAIEAVEAKYRAAEEERLSKIRERTRRYRANDALIPDEMRLSVVQRDGYQCVYCGDDVEVPHIDHVTPASRGGRTTIDNLAVSCGACNSSKRDKLVSEWRGR